MLVQRPLHLRCGTKLLLFALVKMKSVTSTFDRLVTGGLTFGDLAVFRFLV
jgi:hypothetical protein